MDGRGRDTVRYSNLIYRLDLYRSPPPSPPPLLQSPPHKETFLQGNSRPFPGNPFCRGFIFSLFSRGKISEEHVALVDLTGLL